MRFKSIAVNTAAFIFLLCGPGYSIADIVDKVAIVVNDEIVTEGEINNMLAPVYQQYKEKYSGQELFSELEKVRQRIVEQLIDDRLLTSEAKRLNVEMPDADIDAKINEAMGRFPSREQFEAALAEQNLTVKDLRKRYKEQLMVRKFVSQKIGGRIIITPLDIENYYKERVDEFVQPDEIEVSSILIRGQENPEKALETATDIVEKLKAGSDFAELAKTYSEGPNASDGGRMGYIKKGELMPELENVLFTMKEGEVSGIIRTGLGYHIFKVGKRKESTKLTLPEVRKQIEEEIYMERANKKTKELVEDLKKNAYIALK